LTLAAAGVAALSGFATRSAHSSRTQTSTTLLALQKLDELRSLQWTRDEAGFAISDTTTDVSVQPHATGGTGLLPSPANALDVNVAGFADFLAPDGSWLSGGTNPPPAAMFVRRWRLAPLAEQPTDVVIVEVLVTTVARRGQPRAPRVRDGDDALVTSIVARRLP
jgi:hypothetical protein